MTSPTALSQPEMETRYNAQDQCVAIQDERGRYLKEIPATPTSRSDRAIS